MAALRLPRANEDPAVIVDEPRDVCVVGLGAAGGTIATALAHRGVDVVALEAGPDTELTADGARFDGRLFDDDEVTHVADRRLLHHDPERLVLDGRDLGPGPWLARNRGVGGPFAWTGFAYRFHPSDFAVASTAGVPTDSTVADWPISYDDLAPWYEEAERFMHVAGTAGENPFEAPRTGPYPAPANPVNEASARIAVAARAAGYHPYRPPAAIVGRPVGAAGVCDRCGTCTFYGCHRDAKFSTAVAGLTAARAGGGVDVRARCTATQVV